MMLVCYILNSKGLEQVCGDLPSPIPQTHGPGCRNPKGYTSEKKRYGNEASFWISLSSGAAFPKAERSTG